MNNPSSPSVWYTISPVTAVNDVLWASVILGGKNPFDVDVKSSRADELGVDVPIPTLLPLNTNKFDSVDDENVIVFELKETTLLPDKVPLPLYNVVGVNAVKPDMVVLIFPVPDNVIVPEEYVPPVTAFTP